MFVNNDKVYLHLHIPTIAYAIKRIWESHLALNIQVIHKVMRNFKHSFIKHPPPPLPHLALS